MVRAFNENDVPQNRCLTSRVLFSSAIAPDDDDNATTPSRLILIGILAVEVKHFEQRED